MFKHVSFDVWNTIVKPNPEFALYRTKLLALILNLDVDFVKRAYTTTKRVVDSAAEIDGTAFSTPEVYKLLFAACGVSVSPGLAREIRETVDEVFRKHPPIIVPTNVELMGWLHDEGFTTSIGSNSNFVSGDVMHPFLEEALGHKFQFGVYSDLIGHGKPAPQFFNLIHTRLRNIRPDALCEEILHVGDNNICDVQGATSHGMSGLLIESPDVLMERVIHAIVINRRQGSTQ